MTPAETLKRYWGYDGFRPLQGELVESVLSGHDTLGLMPTGGGKSITFQVPGIMLPGLTLVITPLISLMKDQVDNLKRRHIKAAALHSGLSQRERTLVRERLLNGGLKFLYVSPERLASDDFLAQIRMLEVSLIVVDEAHCISQWGYDFRPAYLNIVRLRKEKPGVQVMALTATATPVVADDICLRLAMHNPVRLSMSFSRSNISYVVRSVELKIQEVVHILNRTQGSAIVYVRSRRRTVELAAFLNSCGISSEPYHAGLDPEVKEGCQNRWKSGQTRVAVATNAFGMGIDKPDVRVVIHYDLPPSLEEYYQEAGRAGRDGLTAYAVLLASNKDKGVLRRRVSEAFPPRETIRKIYERVCNVLGVAVGEGYDALYEFDLDKFCETFGYAARQCRAALRLLGQAGYLEFLEEADRSSRIMLTCGREELYHLRGLSAMAERVLTCALRGYEGLFSDYVRISEERLARDAATDARNVYQALLELSRMKVLSYVPRSRMPLMHLPTSREEPRYVVIGKDIYEQRLDVLRNRTEAMLDYAFNASSCRENRMLAYFGEEKGTQCGRCDVCRKKRANKGSRVDPADDVRLVYDAICENAEGMDLRLLDDRLRMPADRLSESISFLAGEGYIRVEGTWIQKC